MEHSYTSFVAATDTVVHSRIGPAAAAYRDWLTCIYSIGSDIKNLKQDAFNISEFNDVLYNINSDIKWSARSQNLIDLIRNNGTEYDQLKRALRTLKAQRDIFKTRIKVTLTASDTSRAEIENYLSEFVRCAQSYTTCINPNRKNVGKGSSALRKVLRCIKLFTNCLTNLNGILQNSKSDTREKLENIVLFAAHTAVIFCVDKIGVNLIDAYFNDSAAVALTNRLNAAGTVERDARLYFSGLTSNSTSFREATDFRRRIKPDIEKRALVYSNAAGNIINSLTGGTVQRGVDGNEYNRYTFNSGNDASRQKLFRAAQQVIDRAEDVIDWTADTAVSSWQQMYPLIARLVDGLWQGVYGIAGIMLSGPMTLMSQLPDLGFTTLLKAVLAYLENISGLTTSMLGSFLISLRNMGTFNFIQLCYSAYVLFASTPNDLMMTNFLQQSVIGSCMFLLGRSISALSSIMLTSSIEKRLTNDVDFENNIKSIVRDALVDLNKSKPEDIAESIFESVSQAASSTVSRNELMQTDIYALPSKQLSDRLRVIQQSEDDEEEDSKLSKTDKKPKRVYLKPSEYDTKLKKGVYDPTLQGFRSLAQIKPQLDDGCRVYKGIYPKDKRKQAYILEC